MEKEKETVQNEPEITKAKASKLKVKRICQLNIRLTVTAIIVVSKCFKV
jgi:hypothetical protein